MATASSIILSPLAAIYGTVTKTRLALYRRGLLKSSKLDVPVISVGNITAGGTGKTPLVEYFARAVAAAGRSVCILTRGYGRENPGNRVLVSDGISVLASERQAGDEPTLLAEKLRGIASVISDADRFGAGRWAIANLGSEVLILDDGFQHLQLYRDLNVATVDATNPWGNGQLLPVGRLREPRRGLVRADCIVVTRADHAQSVDVLKHDLQTFSGNRPLFISRMRVRGLRQLNNRNTHEAIGSYQQIKDPVAAFSAIGNQGSFIQQMEGAGFKPVSVSAFPDHHRYSQRDVDETVNKARMAGAQSLVTTAKDAVKLNTFSFSLPCYVLDIEIDIDDAARFDEMLKRAICAG